ncbi:myb-like protein X [Cydia splendana]|uniref:myb-like protein X n=1 Tax=Cydia splendana TaxID=1100963 RepID=UPI00300D88E0
MRILIVLVLVLCECRAIRVPVVWDESKNSEVKEVPVTLQQSQQQSIPTEYFEYKAHKPEFAVDVAKFHGVKNPYEHYKAYPVRPFTGKHKPELGIHHMLDEDKEIYKPFQHYVNGDEEIQSQIIPTASSYEVFHPYKAEEPALQEMYKDPILDKIRGDLENSKAMAQKYEQEAGEPNIEEGEYLESPEQTDKKKFPHKNIPAPYEIHRPLRRPVYYRAPPKAFTHEQILNHKFRHPWNQNFVKVRPLHYRPLKSHLHNLRQHHALKYDDERNEYPQVPQSENYAEPPDGYDIYLKGQERYNKLRNNVDESINKAVLNNRPPAYERLELQNKDNSEENDENDFVPIKSYAQVRKTETTKHLPKAAALADAISYDDIVNAHRLREAVKSTKAQTVYSEEGYEDAAYDHAGEQKHASDHEGHGGFLKESEISGGKYKTPSFNGKYQDSSGSVYRDKKLHGKKWKEDNKDKDDQNDSEDYTEDEHDNYEEEDAYGNVPDDDVRHKREHDSKNDQDNESSNNSPVHEQDENNEEREGQEEEEEGAVEQDSDNSSNNEESRHKREDKPATTANLTEADHDVNKREANFEIPEFDFNSTFLSEEELNKIAKLKLPNKKKSNLSEKYPYYFIKLKSVNKDSPLRYAENLKLMPVKSKGGTEFYDSRSNIECAEVDDEVDPIPEKIKNNGTQTSEEHSDDDQPNAGEKAKFDNSKNKQRLKGLGDKIDCFKAKYFGKNPLDSPFFKEDIIANPEPIKTPKLETFKLNNFGKLSSNLNGDSFKDATDFALLRDKLNNGSTALQDSLVKATEELKSSVLLPSNFSFLDANQQSKVYADILKNIKQNFQDPFVRHSDAKVVDRLFNTSVDDNEAKNVTYESLKNREDVTKPPSLLRRKRAAPFIYEPYKIIREGQGQESKKTTTTGNISPLIKQLQSSKVVEKVLNFNHDNDQPVKRNVRTRTYKDISRKDREKTTNKDEIGFADMNIDHRRGEPRYEIKPTNHKTHYSPVDHKKAMSVEDYETRTNTTIAPTRNSKSSKAKFVESRLSPSSIESAASKTVNRVVSTTSASKKIKEPQKPIESEESGEEYDEYEDDEEVPTTTTTTTIKPSFRRRARPTTTTAKPTKVEEDEEDDAEELPKLRLITRFNKPHITEKPVIKKESIKYKPTEIDTHDDINAPKYTEKKKKTRKSTLVTDTKRYGDEDDDDMMKEEVDAMIGGKHNMNEYVPSYEKEADTVMEKIKKKVPESSEEDEGSEEEDDEDEDDDDDEDDDEDEDEREDDDDEASPSSGEDETEKESHPEPVVLTTPEPTKRTLLRTTEAPISTTEARNLKIDLKPIIHKKKVEIHKELPVNMSAPHVTQFRQDIKEVEIIKELPQKRRKPQKNVEALNLFKDETLAEDINKLKDVEIFRENLDFKQGPRHGGNYRAAEIKLAPVVSSTQTPLRRRGSGQQRFAQKPEIEESDIKDIEVNSKRGGHMKLKKDGRVKDNEPANAKHIELSELDEPRALHGGNLKSLQDTYKSRGNNKSAKLIELDDEYDNDDDDSDKRHGSYDNNGSKGGLHGGNYRSAKLVQAEAPKDDSEKNNKQELQSRSKNLKNGRHSAADVLEGFAKAVPLLTTTPNYIKDPSKRMYYYVDT